MPRTGYKTSKYLSIEPDRWQTFKPGDTISGQVLNTERTKHGVSSVTLRLYGRAKTKISRKMEHGSTFYRNRFNFFDKAETTWTLVESLGLNEKPDTQSWRFQAPIPPRLSASAIMAESKQETSFLPLDPASISATSIPDVFSYTKTNSWTGITVSCFVEYYLEAELLTTKEKSYKATLPLLIQTPVSLTPLLSAQYAIQQAREPFSIPASKLLTKDILSTMQPRKNGFFSRSKISDIAYHLEIACAHRLQLGSRIPISLRVVVADTDKDTDADLTPTLDVRLDSIKLTIKSTTTGLAPATISPKQKSMSEKYVVESKNLLENTKNVSVPFGGDSKSLDVGEVLDLVLQHDGVSSFGKRAGKEFKPHLSSDMISYGIKHTHQFIWDLSIEIVGLKRFHKAHIETDVQIVGPCQETMDKMIGDLTDAERQQRFKHVVTAGELGLASMMVVSEIIQAFSA